MAIDHWSPLDLCQIIKSYFHQKYLPMVRMVWFNRNGICPLSQPKISDQYQQFRQCSAVQTSRNCINLPEYFVAGRQAADFPFWFINFVSKTWLHFSCELLQKVSARIPRCSCVLFLAKFVLCLDNVQNYLQWIIKIQILLTDIEAKER